MKSFSSAFLKAYLLKYLFIAEENLSSPINERSYLIVEAPLAYVIPSKILSAASVLATSPAIG